MPDGSKPRPAAMAETRVSTKGQVVLPKAVRDRLGWRPGTRVVVEETADGVTLRRAPVFPPKTLDEVVGMLKYDGPPISLEDMDQAIDEEVAARHARGRY